ncbi:MAG TPA: D-glycero-beta-D-manno-heptose 1,7-bisphosphate 7-phosphatase [Methylotenera sp.]|jgi:D-glycero-D-manno-heptose 1,7-bisphosphate phosphatase|nr:D-glycero-beta-D-manno-heptose 1,7-bisphosphate 7-phosphatase [Methylotenera sp.]
MKLVILDRDGVINQDSTQFIKNPDEWIPIPGSLEAIALLNQSGFKVAIATNQSGISRGLFDMATLNAIHDKMHHALSSYGGRVDAIFYCPHAADEHCHCRKPEAGMIEEIGKRFSIDLVGVPAVGDALRDLQAFANAGCQPILVRTGKGEATLAASLTHADKALPPNTWVCADLAEAVHKMIEVDR